MQEMEQQVPNYARVFEFGSQVIDYASHLTEFGDLLEDVIHLYEGLNFAELPMRLSLVCQLTMNCSCLSFDRRLRVSRACRQRLQATGVLPGDGSCRIRDGAFQEEPVLCRGMPRDG